MLKINRENKTLDRLKEPSLANAQILERSDLQEYIYNSQKDFFAEIGENLFILGKEIPTSSIVQDRIDLLGIDSEGAAVIVELKRGSNKLQMLQAISYAGMIARWGIDDFRGLVTEESWGQLTDFLNVDFEEINRRQRILLIAEGYDYALLSGAEWLSEQYGVDIRCLSISLASEQTTGSEYLACTGVFPPPALADHSVARQSSRRNASPVRWKDWNEALSQIGNEALKAFAKRELENGREEYLRKRGLHFRLDGKRRWGLYCKIKHAYVWQRGRFSADTNFWRERLSEPESVKPVKKGRALAFYLWTETDFSAFKEAVSEGLKHEIWSETFSDEVEQENGDLID